MIGAAAGMPSIVHALPAPEHPARDGTVSLAGDWRFALDSADVGAADYWFNKTMPSDLSIRLPGILQTQGFGDEITAETQFVAALPRDMRWYVLPQYKPYTAPGNVKVPYLSQPVRHYLGVAWYQRDIEIPEGWAGKRITLHLERTRWRTDVYVGNRLVGTDSSLVAPHDFDLGVLPVGKHRLTLRIDNGMQEPVYRPDGHAVSDGEGATWNGVVGRIELAATPLVWIEDAQVHPHLANKTADVRVTIGNASGAAGSGVLKANGVSVPVTWAPGGGQASITVPMRDARPWSEFTPHLQTVTLTLESAGVSDQRDVTFGMREIATDGRRIMLNGDVLNLRGTHDGGGFPLTGYPATDVETWKRIFAICKAWGLNGMRFHSWCPPDAAFTAADEIGFYLQPECGMWNNFDPAGRMLAVLHDETARLIKAYGNHPSFVMLGAGNEPAGQFHAQLPGWDMRWKAADPRRLYTDGTGRHARPPQGPGTRFAADFLVIGDDVRGPRGWFGEDYEEELRARIGGVEQPVISHETGQWCSYPDFSVIDKFAGGRTYAAFPNGKDLGDRPYMVPGNYEIMRDFARAHGVADINTQMARASGRFQVACYKEEIEANLRTPSHSGFQMLDLHDYLGQGGALVGPLDAFWEEKGYVGAAQWREFCSATVPLVRLKDRVFTTGQRLTAAAELYHFGARDFASIDPRWRIVDTAGRTVVSGKLPRRAAPRGKGIALGTIDVDLSSLPAPAAYELILDLRGTTVRNRWPIWVYPAEVPQSQSDRIVVTTKWAEARAALAAGGRVLFLSGNPVPGNPDLAMTTVPIFWNRLMNPSRAWMLGLLNDAPHPALHGFPSQANCDWQWIDLIGQTTAMNMEALAPTLKPIVRPIDDWNRSLRLALLFEVRAGPGRLMVSAFDLSESGLADRRGGPSLRRSILDYMASGRFAPSVSHDLGSLDAWITKRHIAPVTTLSPLPNTDVVDPGQLRLR